jgi:HEAT repeats
MRLLALFALLFVFPQYHDAFPPLGLIDFYGLHKVSEVQVRQALGIHEGDSIDITQIEKLQRESEQRISAIPGVKAAFLNFGCCTDDRKSTLYVGIQEVGTSCMTFHPVPKGKVRLTEDVIRAGSEFETALTKAIESGDSAEDDSQGQALNHNPEVRAIQLRFPVLAQEHLANLKDVLRNSDDADQRALAAQVLAYVKEKQSVVPVLTAAIHDSSSNVRNTAARALMVFARYSQKAPAPKIRVSPQPFIEMLNSCIWTDRNKSSLALAELTNSRDPALLAEIRKQALPSLIEMARWKLPGHAAPSLVMLGRIGGLSELQIQKDLETSRQELILAAAKKASQGAN